MRNSKMRGRRLLALVAVAAGLCCAGAVPSMAQGSAGFYAGKSVDLIITYQVGGGYDTYGRLVSRHLPDHLAGRPTFIMRNMPGAGGLRGTNYLYNAAPKDGSSFGVVPDNLALRQVLAEPNIEYDARLFNWVGRMTSATTVYYAWHTSQTKTAADLFVRETVVGGTGGQSNNIMIPLALKTLLDAKIKLIKGFAGAPGLDNALERGEIEMVSKPWEAVKTGRTQQWLQERKINLILQFSMTRHPDMKDIAAIGDLVKTDEQRQIMRMLTNPGDIGRAMTLPPGVPADRVEQVRAAFMAMSKDAKYLAEAQKLQLDIDPISGTELQKDIEAAFDIPAAAVEKARTIVLID